MTKRMITGAAMLIWLMLHSTLAPANTRLQPAEGRKLHYRIIGFTDPTLLPNGVYRLEIAQGNIVSADSFAHCKLIKKSFKGTKVIGEVPAFGASYTWRIVDEKYAGKKGDILHHFQVNSFAMVDTTKYRLKVVNNQLKNTGESYVFLDGFGTLYDMHGKPVWYLPELEKHVSPLNTVRDLKVSSGHTITYMHNQQAKEINWDGLILWEAPPSVMARAGVGAGGYHHEVTRLKNGHYMTLGEENSNGSPDGKRIQGKFGTVMEFNKSGDLVWSWLSSSVYGSVRYMYNRNKPMGEYDVHENAFYLDEQRGLLYVSFKNVSQIVKLSYPDSKVLAVYGRKYLEPGSDQSLIYEQHACKVSQDGHLYLYNNNNSNDTRAGFHPKIMVFDEEGGELHTQWEYEYKSAFETLRLPEAILTSGGNVQELADGSFFASSCTPLSNLFIVNRSKQLLWEATPEKYIDEEKSWRRSQQYRASMVMSRKELEQMIWTTE